MILTNQNSDGLILPCLIFVMLLLCQCKSNCPAVMLVKHPGKTGSHMGIVLLRIVYTSILFSVPVNEVQT